MPKKTQLNNLSQEVFDFFTPVSEWPEGYMEGLQLVQFYNDNILGFDIETEGLNPYDKKMRVISVAFSGRKNFAQSSYTLKSLNMDDYSKLKELLENPKNVIIGHNIKYDINWITLKFNIQVRCLLFDTMFAQYLLDENIESNSLGYLVDQYIPELRGYKEVVNRSNLKLAAKDDVLIYNCKDADASRRLYDIFVPQLKKGKYDKLMVTSSMVLPILSKMETRGIYLDKEWANATQVKLFNSLVENRYDMSAITKTNIDPDSHTSLSNILYKHFGFTPTKYTDTGKPSTDSEAIGYLYDQVSREDQSLFLDSLLSYKKKLKLLTTYYQPIERWTRYDGRVHTNYSLGKQKHEEASGGTVTGRLSSNNPNLQNIPRGKEHRGMFAASEGYTFLDGDFSQLELRVAAYLSQEPVMLDAFNNGLDIHTAVMSDLQGIPYTELVKLLNDPSGEGYEKSKNDRVAIKRINFGILYGVQAQRLQRLLRLELGLDFGLDYCEDIIKKWLSRYAKISEWIKRQKLQASTFKYVAMPLGQKRRLPEATFDSPEGRRALRQATNFPVQSFASWICLIGLIILDQYFKDNREDIDGHIILQVHDSVTSEVKLINESGNHSTLEDIKVDIQNIMEKDTLAYIRDIFGVNFNCPLEFKVNIQERWS